MLLSIAIPTYNRAEYLSLCIDSLLIQFKQDQYLKDKIDILIVDNCSTDNTTDIVNNVIDSNSLYKISYIRNSANIGLDGNITKAFDLATGDFVVVFGDDDIYIKGALVKIISVLEQNPNSGNVYINHYAFRKSFIENMPNNISPFYYRYLDLQSYFDRVNYYFTYTSGNIINKKKMSEAFELNRFLGTNVNLLNWIFDVVLSTSNNIVVEDRLIGMKIENTGGYGFAETFGPNQSLILKYYESKGYKPKLFNVIHNEMLSSYFPSLIVKTKMSIGKYLKEDTYTILYNLYKHNYRFWIFCYPALKLKHPFTFIPFAFNKLYLLFIKKL